MKRLLRVRMLVVLLALALVPAATLPFAERLRTEWARYWEPRVEASDEADLQPEFIPDFPQATRNDSGARFVVVPAFAADELGRLKGKRERFEAERRLIRNEQLAQEVADAVWNNRSTAADQRVD